jgi:hypothetical protein
LVQNPSALRQTPLEGMSSRASGAMRSQRGFFSPAGNLRTPESCSRTRIWAMLSA